LCTVDGTSLRCFGEVSLKVQRDSDSVRLGDFTWNFHSASMVFSCITLVAGYLALWQLMFLPPLMWHWKDDQPPLNPIYSRLAKYPVKLTAQQEQQYDQELSSWISSGWLIPYDEKKFGPVKVRLDPSLYPHQVVRYRGSRYVLSRMCFGLCTSPRVLTCIVAYILQRSGLPVALADSYVDDIYVADKALVPKVVEQFRLFGLPCKEPEPLGAGARVLGLELVDDHGDLCWTRRPDWCGRLTSHYPICDWLRPATSYLKRICCEGLGSNAAWDRPVLP
ncbi:hypothetical protein FOZ61_003042, partial [Perkinsus olseni]